jgi:chromosomal replication initiation ATPase DnaA
MEILTLKQIHEDELLDASQVISKNLNIEISKKNLIYLINHSKRDIKTIYKILSKIEKRSLERKKSIGLNLIKEVIQSS